MSTGAKAAGLEPIAGFEQNPKFEQLYLANGGTDFFTMDIHDVKCVEQAVELGGQNAVVMAGIACQPYSMLCHHMCLGSMVRGRVPRGAGRNGGYRNRQVPLQRNDKKGGSDCRASTLPASLRFAWLIQSPIIILECTPTALTNEFVQSQIKQFAQTAGYHVHQQVLHLHWQWVGRRDRWWCVLSARPLGPIEFDNLPEATDYKVVSDVMHEQCVWPDTEIAALDSNIVFFRP